MHRAKADARASHVTVGLVRHLPGDREEIDCSCGMTLTNGPQWSLDEHIRLHRAEARYLALSEVAPAGMPRTHPRGPGGCPAEGTSLSRSRFSAEPFRAAT